MSNKPKPRLPAHNLRTQAFVYFLSQELLDVNIDRKPNPEAIAGALWFSIDESTIRKWFNGKVRPRHNYVKLIEQKFPSLGNWLIPNMTSPLMRFLCALDIWGSPYNSIERTLDKMGGITAGKGLESIARRWAPVPIASTSNSIKGYAIPAIRRHVPVNVKVDLYKPQDLLTVVNYLLSLCAYLELTEIERLYFSFDFCSAILFARAYIDNQTLHNQMMSGEIGNITASLYTIFFEHENFRINKENMTLTLSQFKPECEEECFFRNIYFCRAAMYKIFKELNSNVRVVNELFLEANVNGGKWGNPLEGAIPESLIFVRKKNFTPQFPGRYEYEFKYLPNGDQTVICIDSLNNENFELPKLRDLFEYSGTFTWGYVGTGPLFLSYSLLGHHLGHGDFSSDDAERLLNVIVSKIPEDNFSEPFRVTDSIINDCINLKTTE